jgi:hypothetical protein
MVADMGVTFGAKEFQGQKREKVALSRDKLGAG